MPISRVDKYGVPIDTQSDVRAPLIQPKFVNRFRVFFYDLGTSKKTSQDNSSQPDTASITSTNAVTSMVESFNRPTLNFGTQEATSFIGRAKYSGRLKHETFSFVLRDDISNSVMAKVYAQAKKQAYKFHPVTYNLEKSPYLGMDTKFLCVLQIMDGKTNHKSLETWTFFGCTIDSIEPSGSTYEDGAGVSKLTITCAFDHFDITQERRLILPNSKSYDDFDGTQSGGGGADDSRGFLEELGNVTDSATDSVKGVYGKAKESVSGFFSSDDGAKSISPDDPSVGEAGGLWGTPHKPKDRGFF